MTRTFRRAPRSSRENELLDKAARYLPGGVRNATFNPDKTMVIERAAGSRVFDCSGNEYIDYLLGSGPLLLGHAHPAVVRAVQAKASGGSSYLMVSEESVLLAEKIVELVPCAEQVCLHNTGSDSTFFAMRLARAYRGREKILKFEGAYHGMSDYALMSTQWTMKASDDTAPVPNSAGIPQAVADSVLIAPFNDVERTADILNAHRDEIAGVIVEPMQRTFAPKPGFLEGLRERCTAHDIPLIFDEVVTGFRLALGGAQERYGVTPDLCALGKSISGGHPLGVLCGRADILGLVSPANAPKGQHVMQTGTFSHNPISAAAALACIDVLTKPGVYEQLAERGGRLKRGVHAALSDAGIDVCVSGEPAAFQPWFTSVEVVDHRSALTADFAANARFTELLLDRGVVKAHEKFFVSLAHSEQDIDDTLAAVREVASVMAESR